MSPKGRKRRPPSLAAKCYNCIVMIKKPMAIDLDDVLAAHVEAFVEFSNTQYGTDLTIEDYSEHWTEIWKMEREEVEKRAAEFHIHENTAEYAVKEEAVTALETLSKTYDLYIVTARRASMVDNTIIWVDRHFPGVFKDIHFVPIWEPNNTISKADICKRIGANYIIDDLASHCNLAASNGIHAILFGDYAWNRNEEITEDVTRCKNWSEVLSYLKLS